MPGVITNDTTTSLPAGIGVAPNGVIKVQSGPNSFVSERRGLGNVAEFWPDCRIIGAPEVNLESDHSNAVVHFKVPHFSSGAFIAMLLGWPYESADGYRRHIPEHYRNWTFQVDDNWQLAGPTIPVMYCTKAQQVGLGLRTDWTTQNPTKLGLNYYPDPWFEFAIVQAVFETLAYDCLLLSEITETAARPAEMQRYVIKTEDSDGKYLQYATGVWELVHPTTGVRKYAGNRNQNYWESFETVIYEWFDVLPGMTNHVRNQLMCGKTNNALFDNYEAERLLLLRAPRKPMKTQLGQRVYRHRFEFLHVPTGVNRALPPGLNEEIDPLTGNPVYWNIVKKGDTSNTIKPYKATDMSKLFKPA